MYNLMEAEIVVPTKAEAEKTYSTNAYEGDCKLYEEHVAFLVSEMEAGNFHVCIWAFARMGGQIYRINGKHTSLAMQRVDGNLLRKLKVCHLLFKCDDAADLAALYSTFDSMESSRKARDIYQIYAAGVDDLRNIPGRVRDTAVSGLALWRWDRLGNAHSARERGELLTKHAAAVIFINSLFRGADGEAAQECNRMLLRAPVTGAMAATFHVSQKAAREFWMEVRDGSNPDPRNPSRVLQKWLLGAAVSTGRGACPSGRRPDSRRGMFVRCLHAWNAWRDGTATDLKYYDAAKIPTLK